MRKKILSLLLTAAMTLGAFCTLGFAGNAEETAPEYQTVTAYRYNDIVLDGVVDGAWSAVEPIQLGSFNGSTTTATARFLYQDEVPADEGKVVRTLTLLVEVDKHGVTVTDKDSIWFALNLYHNENASRYGEAYGLGIFATTCMGSKQCKQYGWYAVYCSTASEIKVKRTALDKWQAEFRIQLVDSYNENRLYVHGDNGDEKGFGIGTKLGVDILIQDNEKELFGEEFAEEVKGATWTSDVLSEFDFTHNTLVIGDDLVYNPAVYGDVNGDGLVKGNDATLLLKYLAGWDVKINEINADCDGSGEIKGKDSTLLLKYLAGWNVTLGK